MRSRPHHTINYPSRRDFGRVDEIAMGGGVWFLANEWMGIWMEGWGGVGWDSFIYLRGGFMAFFSFEI